MAAGSPGTVCSQCGCAFSPNELVQVQNSWICAKCKPIFLQRLTAPQLPFSATLTGTACAECGRPYPTSEMLRIQNSWVCGNCKPIFLQRLKEGAPAPTWTSLWRSNNAVVTTRTGSVFPDRCIKCNAPVTGKMRRTLTWYPPWVFLVGGVIAAAIFSKKATVEIGLCQEHRSKRVRNMLLGVGLAVGGFLMIVVGGSNDWAILAFLGIAAIIAGIVFMVLSKLLTVQKMDDNHVWVKGFCPPYLNDLPEWRG
jgi:hypothetical protein